MEEHALATRLRLGARLATKHLAAIASAYTAYQAAIRRGVPDVAAQFLAAGIYIGATKAIALSEHADLRSWHSLPTLLIWSHFTSNPEATGPFSKEKRTERKPIIP